MQMSIQQAFVEVCFFQASQLFPTHLQKPAVAYPKGRGAFNSVMCGKRRQLYVFSAWLARGCMANERMAEKQFDVSKKGWEAGLKCSFKYLIQNNVLLLLSCEYALYTLCFTQFFSEFSNKFQLKCFI